MKFVIVFVQLYLNITKLPVFLLYYNYFDQFNWINTDILTVIEVKWTQEEVMLSFAIERLDAKSTPS